MLKASQKANIYSLKPLLIFFVTCYTAACQSCFTDCMQTVNQCSLCYMQCGSVLTMISCGNQQTLFNQRECIEHCCNDGTPATPFTTSTLNNCRPSDQTTKATSTQSAGYYAIIAVGSVACIVLIVIVSREIYKRVKYGSGDNKRVIPMQNQNSIAGLALSQQGTSAVQLPENADHKEFPANTDDIIKDETNCCCICLQEKVNCVTKCGHVFHLKCLIQWMARKNSCPLCNSKSTYQAKLYCLDCYKEMGVLDIRIIPKSQLQKITLQKCKSCRK